MNKKILVAQLGKRNVRDSKYVHFSTEGQNGLSDQGYKYIKHDEHEKCYSRVFFDKNSLGM